MTVGASDFALCYFGFYGGPTIALGEQVRYLIYLVPMYMVEFEDANITVATIDAGVPGEVDTQHLIAFGWLFSRLGAAPAVALLNSFDAVTVGAAYLALIDLGFDSGPINAPGKKIRYVTGFLPIDMVEFEKVHIFLTTIDARMCGEVGSDMRCVFN
jgi:hypothetical protein